MTSKLKVNLINDSGDNNIITSDGSGVLTASKFKIIQHQYVRAKSSLTTSSTTAAEISSDLRVTITPTSASNDIIIQYKIGWIDNLAAGRDIKIAIYRDSTNLLSDAGANDNWYFYCGDQFQGTWEGFWIDDSHNSTSQLTYKLYAWSGGVGQITVGSTTKFTYGEAMEVLP